MREVMSYNGKVRNFRAWLRKQKCQVIDLAQYRERKTARKRPTLKTVG